jgi:vacuolar protein sorting-associated protein 35
MALRLFMQAAQTADRLADFEAISYEFVAQAFIAYEDEVSDSKAQYAAINLIVASLQTFTSFTQENYGEAHGGGGCCFWPRCDGCCCLRRPLVSDISCCCCSLLCSCVDTLVSKATQHCAKLLKKTDQCRSVYKCSLLFWPGDDKNVRAAPNSKPWRTHDQKLRWLILCPSVFCVRSARSP